MVRIVGETCVGDRIYGYIEEMDVNLMSEFLNGKTILKQKAES